MGMKVAAVSIMCQDKRVFDAMKMAGTPCPFLGKIGKDASDAWDKYAELQPKTKKEEDSLGDQVVKGTGAGIGLAGLLLLIL